MRTENMAAREELMNKTFEEAFDFIKYTFNVDKLYDDQISLIKAFCNGQNILFNAPTGYGKSLVYQSLPWVLDILNEQTIGFSTLIVISPLVSLMEDQCNRMKEIGVSSIALNSDNMGCASVIKDVQEGLYSLVFASPECLLGKKTWRNILCSDDFRDHCVGVAFDEAHIIAQWGTDAVGKTPFRKWYGELNQLRSLLEPAIRFALFTATATYQTKHRIFAMLEINISQTFFIEKNPERSNIRYCVQYIENTSEISGIFSSVINELIEMKEKCCRRLIYTQTRNQCATIFNVFSTELKEKLYLNSESNSRYRLVDMFHGGTPEVVKKHIVSQLTDPNSYLRIVVCTVAFSMGVNCKGVSESIHFGAPKSLETYVQESGRIGRDGTSSISRILFNAMLSRGADHEIKQYIKETECRRINLMKNFENHVPTKVKGCKCCDNCAKSCICSLSCCEWTTMDVATRTTPAPEVTTRSVLPEHRKQLHMLLTEYHDKLTQERTKSFPSVHAEFYSFHINQVVNKCQYLFTLDDIHNHVEIWRKVHALNILCMLHKVFGDITEDTDSIDFMDIDQSMESLPDEWISIRDDSEAELLSFWDSYMLQSFEESSQVTDKDESEISEEHVLEQSSFDEA